MPSSGIHCLAHNVGLDANLPVCASKATHSPGLRQSDCDLFAAGGSSVLALAPWFVAAGVAIGCVETAEHAAVAALAPVELRGSAFGLLAAVQSFGDLAASAIAGLLWTLASPRPFGEDGNLTTLQALDHPFDHPFDHPDDPTGPVSIRPDRRGIQREQARSFWSRPDRRRASVS